MVRYRWRYAAGFFMLCWRSGMAAALPYIIGRAVDYLSADFTVAGLGWYAAAMIGAAGLKAVGQYYMRWILITLSRDIEYDLRNDLSAHLVTLPKRFYDSYRTGDLMARATTTWRRCARCSVGSHVHVRDRGHLYRRHDRNGGDGLGADAADLRSHAAGVAFGRLLRPADPRSIPKDTGAVSAISAGVQEHLANIRMLRAYGQGPQEQERFRKLNDDYLRDNLGLIKIWRVFYPLLEALVGLAYIAVLGFGGLRVLRGRNYRGHVPHVHFFPCPCSLGR